VDIKIDKINKVDIRSVDRNIRACYPNKSESEIYMLVLENIKANIDNIKTCKEK
jgi:lauroyl/myristoyl acyltransferase